MDSKLIIAMLMVNMSYGSMGMLQNEKIVPISNGPLQVGVLVEVGGTIVSLR